MSKQKLLLIGAGAVAGYFFARQLTGLNIPGFNPFAFAAQKATDLVA
jgi:hypothetical protein